MGDIKAAFLRIRAVRKLFAQIIAFGLGSVNIDI